MTSVIAQFVDAYVLRPYAVRNPEELHKIGSRAAIGLAISFAAMWLLSSVIRLRTVSVLDAAAFGATS